MPPNPPRAFNQLQTSSAEEKTPLKICGNYAPPPSFKFLVTPLIPLPLQNPSYASDFEV